MIEIMSEVTRIVKDGHGSGGFLNPPGDPAHLYSVITYAGPRSKKINGIAGLESVIKDDWAPEHVREQARRILAEADRTASELWVQQVYGYFRNMWTTDGAPWSSTEALASGRPDGAPDEYHAGCVFVRKFFPDHTPRVDLIADPGNGYGSSPCVKCGERVQYEARYDALCVVTTRMTGSGITEWTYNAECAKGGQHSR